MNSDPTKKNFAFRNSLDQAFNYKEIRHQENSYNASSKWSLLSEVDRYAQGQGGSRRQVSQVGEAFANHRMPNSYDEQSGLTSSFTTRTGRPAEFHRNR